MNVPIPLSATGLWYGLGMNPGGSKVFNPDQGSVQYAPFLIRRTIMKNTSDMSKEELDLYSNINNPNNDADMDDWADGHNPNNDDYLDE